MLVQGRRSRTLEINQSLWNSPSFQCSETSPALQLQQPLRFQIVDNLLYRLFHALLVTPDCNFGILWCLIRRTDARELWNLALTRLLVQTLRVALLGLFERDVDEDFNKGERLVLWVCVGLCGVEIARRLTIGFIGRDERCNSDGSRVGEELCYLKSHQVNTCVF
jgi:hypothetical protein